MQQPPPPSPPIKPPSIEQIEYDRVYAELETTFETLAAGVSNLLPENLRKLVVMAAVLRHAARMSIEIGMGRGDFEKRCASTADRAYAPRVEIPKIIV